MYFLYICMDDSLLPVSHGLLVPSGPVFPTIKSKANFSPVSGVASFKFSSVFSHFRNVKRQPYLKNMTFVSTHRVLCKHIRPITVRQECSIFMNYASRERRWNRQRSQEEAALRRRVSIRLWYICRAIGTEWRAAEHKMKSSLDFIRLHSHCVSIGRSSSAVGIPNLVFCHC